MSKIDLTQFSEFLGIDINDETTQEDLHNAIKTNFVKRDAITQDENIVNSIVGKRLGTLETEVKKIARNYGIEFTEEHKDAKVEDLIAWTTKQLDTKRSNEINELKSSIDNNDFQEQLKTWENKYQGLESKYNDTVGLLENTKNEFTAFKDKRDKELKDFKLSTVINEKKSKVKLKNGITEVEKAGFDTIMSQKYFFDMDEDGKVLPFNRETGKRIENPKKMGEFLSVEEAFEIEAANLKLLAVNDKAEQGADKKLGSSLATYSGQTVPSPTTEGGRKRVMSSAAQQ